jgi:hypothetical protein
VFFLSTYWFYSQYVRGNDVHKNVIFVFVALAGLTLTKFSFLFLVPALTAACLGREFLNRAGAKRGINSAMVLILMLATAVVAITLFFNWIKFGSPFLTGYEQWEADEVHFTGSYLSFFRDVFFSEQWGLFSLFPILFFSVPFIGRYCRRFRFEAAFVFGSLLIHMAMIGKLPIWRGAWCYGPRYFVFVLPLVALPALSFFDWLFSREANKEWQALGAAAAGGVLGLSLFFQFQVERADPFLYFRVSPHLNSSVKDCLKDQDSINYFAQAHFGRINFALLKEREDVEKLWFMPKLRAECGGYRYEAFKVLLMHWLNRSNFYWLRNGPAV